MHFYNRCEEANRLVFNITPCAKILFPSDSFFCVVHLFTALFMLYKTLVSCCGGTSISRGAPSPDAVAPPPCHHVPHRPQPLEGPPFAHTGFLAPCPPLPARLATARPLSAAFARSRVRHTQLSQDLGSPSFPLCDWCTGLYNTTRGTAEEETTEADA